MYTSWDARSSHSEENLYERVCLLVLITALIADGQTPASRKLKSDAEKIESALRAGPKFVIQNATVLDWPTSPGIEYRVLRTGTTGWTCLPGFPGIRP